MNLLIFFKILYGKVYIFILISAIEYDYFCNITQNLPIFNFFYHSKSVNIQSYVIQSKLKTFQFKPISLIAFNIIY